MTAYATIEMVGGPKDGIHLLIHNNMEEILVPVYVPVRVAHIIPLPAKVNRHLYRRADATTFVYEGQV